MDPEMKEMTTKCFRGRLKTFHYVAWAFVVLLVAAVITLGVFLGITVNDKNALTMRSENGYLSSYYTLTDSLLQIENNLSKMRVVRTPSLQSELLTKAAINAEVSEQCLSALSISGANMQSTVKFCNQVGDYSLYLLRKLDSGESLSDTDYSTLDKLYETTRLLGEKMNSLSEKISSGDYSFSADLGAEDDAFSSIVSDIADGAIEYPALIYDGPFSDGLDDPSPVALEGEEISQEKGAELLKTYLTDYSDVIVKYEGELGGFIEGYSYSFTAGEVSGNAQLSKIGGKLVMADVNDSVSDPKFTKEEGVELAEQYCEKIGIDNMSAVWACVTDSELYVNLCYKEDGIVFYPDMVKIKVSLQTGRITGFEAREYIYNHTERDTDYTVSITEEEALAVGYGEMKVESVRLAVIPMDAGGEKLTYEVYGTIDGYGFFVYVDAATGKDVRVLQVIDSDEGELLM